MALNFRKFLDGIRIIPKTSLSVLPEKGDLEVTDGDGKLNYYNGTSSSPVVTEAHSATLTNKTLDSPVITGTPSIQIPIVIEANSASDALRITQTGAGAALRVEDSANPDSTPFIVDAAGNVGIGTPSPTYKLEAVGTIAASDGAGRFVRIIPSSTSATYSVNSNTAEHIFQSGANERLRIDSSGRVGIATSAPSARLEVVDTNDGSGIVVGRLRNSGTTSGTAAVLSLMTNTNSGAAISLGVISAISTNTTGSGDLAFSTTSGGATLEKLRIDSSGKLLINATTSYSAGGISTLSQVNATDAGAGLTAIRWSNNATSSYLILGKSRGATIGTQGVVSSGDELGRIIFAGSDSALIQSSSFISGHIDGSAGVNSLPGRLSFFTAPAGSITGTERLRIDSTGNVGIGTGAQAARLHVVSGSSGEVGRFGFSTGLNYISVGQSGANDSYTTRFGYHVTSEYGYIQAFAASGVPDDIAINPSGGNVGIGTTNPQKLLHLRYTTAANRYPLRLENIETAASADVGLELYAYGGAGAVLVGALQATNNLWTYGVYGANSTALLGVREGGTNIVASNASGVIKFATGGDLASNERLRIDSTGRVGIGTSSPTAILETASETGSIPISTSYSDAPSFDGGIIGRRARGTLAAPTAILSGDRLAGFYSRGYTGSAWSGNSAAMMIFADENYTATANGSRITFETTPVGSTSRTERLRIDSSGNVGIGVTPSAWQSTRRALQLGSAAIFSDVGSTNKIEIGTNSFINSGGNFTYINSDYSTRYLQINGQHVFYRAASGTAGNTVTYSQAMTLDNNSRLLLNDGGSARNIGTSLVSSSIQVEGTNSNTSSILAYGNSNSAPSSGILVLGKSRGTTVGSVTAAQNGDSLGRIHFMGADGTSGGVTAAFIIGQVDGTVATNVMPGALTFWTTPASSNTPSERLRIDSTGNVGIGTAGTASTTLDVNGNVSVRSSNNAQTGSAVTLTAPTTSFVRLTAGVTSVAGITAGANGQTLTLSNRSGGTVAINNEDATATAANRIRTGSGSSFNLSNEASIQLTYDSTTARWMVVGTASSTTSVVTTIAPLTLTSLNDVVLANSLFGAFTITLPSPVKGKKFTIKKIDPSANPITISPSSGTIDFSSSKLLTGEGDTYTIISDGTDWFII